MTEKNKGGRPSLYSDELAQSIIERLCDGESLRSICRDDGYPTRYTIFNWCDSNPAFAAKYARARQVQADALFDDMLEIADDASNDYMEKRNKEGDVTGYEINGEHHARTKMRLETRKWYAEKLKPKVYGVKAVIEGGDEPVRLQHTIDVSRLSLEELDALEKALGVANGED